MFGIDKYWNIQNCPKKTMNSVLFFSKFNITQGDLKDMLVTMSHNYSSFSVKLQY